MEIWKIILISFIVSIIVDKTWVKLKYKESVYFVVYTFSMLYRKYLYKGQ